ncbi:hypothetical protein N7474_007443 [Penicillium riverlandense]|uniref:uncharacterized protein n=1 Tax=Penicillium riverlandense TaxID=1903569 RepID=UPI00254755F2|nr:uncharacterized protein N7474_007443 [Penicillium riverlandense]KAJ5815666.1 hypothetical protein N7474_007443 [Penicillium riverlandense]
MDESKPATAAGMKRSAPSIHEGPRGWDVTPPMMTPSPSSFHLPFAHYALIYLDNEGKLQVDESASIKEVNFTVFSPEVLQDFLEIFGKRDGFHQPVRRNKMASLRRVKCGRGRTNASTRKERRLEKLYDSENASSPRPLGMVPLRIGDERSILGYYEGALKHFQQFNCRVVAKAFIRFIEPRKQTKPEWWPLGVMHKEPDHLRKEYRIELLIHIVRKLGSYGITADKLKEVASETKRSLKHPSHVEIIYEILRVRKLEERLERGEIDDNMVVYVMNRGPSPNGEDRMLIEGTFSALKEPEHVGGLLTPASSVEQASAALTKQTDTMSSLASSHHLLGGDCNPPFSVLEPLNFGGPGRHDSVYYTTPHHYTDTFFSRAMLNTPSSADMISSLDASVFNYLTQSPFLTSTPDLPPIGTRDQYGSWTPTFSQNIPRPAECGTPGTSQALPPPAMSCHGPWPLQHGHGHAGKHG